MHLFFRAPERRYKIVRLTPELLLDALLSPRLDQSFVRVLRMDGVPEGCQIEAVAWDEWSRCFMFRLFHESFDVLDPAAAIPDLFPVIHQETVRVVRPDQADQPVYANTLGG